MAKAKTSGILTEIRGSIGGTTYRTVGSNLVLSAKSSGRVGQKGAGGTTPVLNQGAMFELANLTPSVRTAWEQAAKQVNWSLRKIWLWSRRWWDYASYVQSSYVMPGTTGTSSWNCAVSIYDVVFTAPRHYNYVYRCIFLSSSGTPASLKTEDGIHATANTGVAGLRWWSACYAEGTGYIIAAPHSASRKIGYSPDGITWGLTTRATDGFWYDCASSPSLRRTVIVGYSGTDLACYTDDGMTFPAAASVPTGNWYGACWAPSLNLFLAAGYATSGSVMVSNDGTNWRMATSSPVVPAHGIAWSERAHRGVMITEGPLRPFYTSVDGENWTSDGVTRAGTWVAVRWFDGLEAFVAWKASGADNVAISCDGITWSYYTSTGITSLRSIYYDANFCVLYLLGSGTNDGIRIAPITWLPNKCDGSPLFTTRGEVPSPAAIPQGIYTIAPPDPRSISWHATTTAGVTSITGTVQSDWSASYAQGALAVWFGRALTGAQSKNNREWRLAGVTNACTGSWPMTSMIYPFAETVAAGARVPVKYRYLTRGRRISGEVISTVTLT